MNLKLKQIELRQMHQAINVKINTPKYSLDYFYRYVTDLVISEPFPSVLAEILKLPLNSPFPTRGISKIEKNYTGELGKENSFSNDLNYYWSSIAGVVSRIIKGRISEYLQEAKEILQKSFWEFHTTYKSIKEDFKEFGDVYKEFLIFEKARMLGLIYITLMDCKSFNIKSEEQ
ncbi:YxiJ family protein [Priestia megaterium]|uniref:YxiJ family protein n=1 Tax=Priestia megaterium TaxID=1404 RepID=UPI001E0C0789|nr:hypothetical protein [Priestia megaterium]